MQGALSPGVSARFGDERDVCALFFGVRRLPRPIVSVVSLRKRDTARTQMSATHKRWRWLSLLVCVLTLLATGIAQAGPRQLLAKGEAGSAEGRIDVGSAVIIEVLDDAGFPSLTVRSVRITSVSTGYDSGLQVLNSGPGAQRLYFRWLTPGLRAASDYVAAVQVQDARGVWASTVTVTLSVRLSELTTLETAVDLYLPFHGIGLSVARSFTYHSARELTRGVLGYGWTHRFAPTLVRDVSGQITLTEGNGVIHVFAPAAGVEYRSLSGYSGSLSRLADGGYRLRTRGGDEWNFSNDLSPQYFQDGGGNRVTCQVVGGRLTRLSDSSGQFITFSYTADGLISRAVDSTGRRVLYTYDTLGNLIGVAPSAAATTLYQYDDRHRLVMVQAAGKRETVFEYDSEGRLSGIDGNAGAAPIHLSYDPSGRQQAMVGPTGKPLTVQRVSPQGFPIRVENGAANGVQFSYSAQAVLNGVTDGNSNTWSIDQSADGNNVTVTTPSGGAVHATYGGEFHRLQEIRDQKNNATNFAYDGSGRLSAISYPDGSAQTSAIDRNADGSSRVVVTTRSGQEIRYLYDARGLLTSKLFPDGNESRFTYDRFGRLTVAENASGAIAIAYDTKSHVRTVTYPGNRVVSYTYDGAGRRKSLTDPDGRIVRYKYDSSGRLAALTDESNRVIAKYAYDADGRLLRRSLGNGVTTTWGYDDGGLVKSLVDARSGEKSVRAWTYSRDGAGNTTGRTSDAGVEAYDLDTTSQLVGATYADSASEQFSYDPAGNRTVVTRRQSNGVTKTTRYQSNSLNQYTAVDGQTLQYDGNGNLSRFQGLRYTYNAEGALTSVRLANGNTVSYSYDALGRLAARTDAAGTRRYIWDGDDLITEDTSTHVTAASYVWGARPEEPLLQTRSGRRLFYLQDENANVTALTDESGAVVESYEYEAFGALRKSTGVPNPFRFAASFFDETTSTYYMRARWYAPQLGRFIQPDPAGVMGGLNLYTYVENSPIDLRDPSGLGFFSSVGRFFNSQAVRTVLHVVSLVVQLPVIYAAWSQAVATAALAASIGSPVLGVLAGTEAYGAYRMTTNWLDQWSRLGEQSPTRSVTDTAVSWCRLGGCPPSLAAPSSAGVLGPVPPPPTPNGPMLSIDAASMPTYKIVVGTSFAVGQPVTLHVIDPWSGEMVFTPAAPDGFGRFSFSLNYNDCGCPGTYQAWAVEAASGNTTNVVVFVVPGPTPAVSVSPTSGPVGTVFQKTYTGFTPNGVIEMHDFVVGVGEFVSRQTARPDGTFTINFFSNQVEGYLFYGKDLTTGKVSNVASFTVLP